MATPHAAPAGAWLLLATHGFTSIDWLLLALIFVLLAISALFSLAETSLVRTSTVKARSMVDDDRRGARALLRLIEQPERFLNPVLLVVLVCQLVAATLVGVLANAWFGPIGVVIGIAFEIVVIFVIFEAVPKNWAVQNPERAALFTAPVVAAVVRFPPIRATSAVLIGLADLLIGRKNKGDEGSSNVTESELLAMADVAMAEDVIETEERAFIHSIIEFGDAVVREVMVPRPDMVALESGLTVSQALDVVLQAGFSRLPVHQGGLDHIVGVTIAKDLITAEHRGHGGDPVQSYVRPASFVPETKRLPSLLREMREQKFHLSIVVDEYGSTAGVVTLEDLIEELVGEIVDEYDVEEPPVQRLDDGSVVVAGGLALSEAEEVLGVDLPQGPWDTVGGLILDVAGRVPEEGETVEVDGVTLVVQRVQGRRIRQVQIRATSRDGGPDATS